MAPPESTSNCIKIRARLNGKSILNSFFRPEPVQETNTPTMDWAICNGKCTISGCCTGTGGRVLRRLLSIKKVGAWLVR